MESHIRFDAGCLNWNVKILKAAKWNLGLRGHYTVNSCRLIPAHKTSDQRKIVFFSKISYVPLQRVLPLPICNFFLNVLHTYVAKFHSVWPRPPDNSYFTPCVCLCANPASPGRRQTDGQISCLLSDPLGFADMTSLQVFSRPRGDTRSWAINVD